jgi:hypothetical protein
LKPQAACLKGIQVPRENFRGWSKTIHALMRACGHFSRTYQLKAIADYLTGPGSHVSQESAREATQTARPLVECVAGLLQTPASTPEPDRLR